MENLYTREYGYREGSTKGLVGLRNKIRLRFFKEWITPKQGEFILDIGCNRALLLQELEHSGAIVSGVDINREIINEVSLDYVKYGDAEQLPYAANSFNKIVCSEVLEHVSDPHKAVMEISRVLKPGGRAYITYPIEPIRGVSALHDAVMAHKNLGYARALHRTRFSRKMLDDLIAQSNLKRYSEFVKFMFWPLKCVELYKEA